jgi:hypothetical protein
VKGKQKKKHENQLKKQMLKDEIEKKLIKKKI